MSASFQGQQQQQQQEVLDGRNTAVDIDDSVSSSSLLDEDDLSVESNDAPMLRKLLRTPFEIPFLPIDYEAVFARLSSHPEEACWSDPFDGSWFLHELLYCDNIPLHIVQKAIDMCPGALQHSYNGFADFDDTPLHIACHTVDATPAIVKVIMNAYKEAVFCEPSPLYRALEFACTYNIYSRQRSLKCQIEHIQNVLRSSDRVEVVKLLLEANPVASIRRINDQDPMDWLADLWTNMIDFDDDVFDRLFEIMKSMLRSRSLAKKCSSKSIPSFSYLHAALREDRIILYHLGYKKKPINLMALEKFRMRLLTNCWLDAFKCDENDKLALHLAAERGLPWCAGLRDVYLAAPRAIETRDIPTHLYPFMISSIGEHANLGTTFELLRTNPSMLKRFIE